MVLFSFFLDNSPMSEQTKGADTVTNTIDSTTAKTTTVNQESEGQYFDEKNFTSTLDELINSNGKHYILVYIKLTA